VILTHSVAFVLGAYGRAGEREEDPWQAAATFLVSDAYQGFSHSKALGENDRKFGLAITLLNMQPRTQGNLERALKSFDEIAETVPKGEPLNALARFFAARVREFYLPAPDLPGASDAYLALIKESTGNPVIELAAARAVMIATFAEPSAGEQPIERVLALESLEPFLTTPEGRREFHAAMGYALLDLGGDVSKAVDHFLAADRVGYTHKAAAMRLWLVAGAAAAKADRIREALVFYGKMVDTYPNDPRTFTVRQHMKALGDAAP